MKRLFKWKQISPPLKLETLIATFWVPETTKRPRCITVSENGSLSCVKARKSKSTEQYDWKLFFRLDGRCYSMVGLSNSTGWDLTSLHKLWAPCGCLFISSVKFWIFTLFTRDFVLFLTIEHWNFRKCFVTRETFSCQWEIYEAGILRIRNHLSRNNGELVSWLEY